MQEFVIGYVTGRGEYEVFQAPAIDEDHAIDIWLADKSYQDTFQLTEIWSLN